MVAFSWKLSASPLSILRLGRWTTAPGAGLLGSKSEGSGSGFDQSIIADPVDPMDLDLDPTKRSRPYKACAFKFLRQVWPFYWRSAPLLGLCNLALARAHRES